MQAIILCGGFSTRLGLIAQDVPKILLKIGNRTVLDCQVDLLREAGVDEVILASGHLHDVLHTEVGESHRGVRIYYSREEQSLGTGGAIRNAMRYLSTYPFFALNGDILLKDFPLCRMSKFFSPKMDGLLLGALVDDIRPYGEIVSDYRGKIETFREKQPIRQSGYVNCAIYLLNQSIANCFPKRKQFSIERAVFPYVPNLYVFKATTDWIDVGVPERLAHARHHIGCEEKTN